MPTTTVALGGLEFFEGCSDKDLAAVTRAMTGERRVREGQVVCAEGEMADRWWIVVEGQADATWRGLYLGTILAGETIGELALLDGKPRTATVTATTDMVLQELEGEGFVAALLEAPQVAVALLRQFAARLRATDRLPALPAIRSRPPAPPVGAATASVFFREGSTREPRASSRIRTPIWRHCKSRRRCTGPSLSAPGW